MQRGKTIAFSSFAPFFGFMYICQIKCFDKNRAHSIFLLLLPLTPCYNHNNVNIKEVNERE